MSSEDGKIKNKTRRTKLVYDVHNEDDPEIVDLNDALKDAYQVCLVNKESQTDPCTEEFFDWDLTDRADIETQTILGVPTRSGSTLTNYHNDFQDAIVQTDERLVFLLNRIKSKEELIANHFVDVAVQTTIVEITETGVQCNLNESSPLNSPSVIAPINNGSVVTHQSDAGFQVDMNLEPPIPVYQPNHHEKSSPIHIHKKSIHLDESSSLGDSRNGGIFHRFQSDNSPNNLEYLVKKDVAVQTDNDIITDENPNYEAKPPPTRKYDLCGDDDSILFDAVDTWVASLSQKTFKSSKKLIKSLLNFLQPEELNDPRNELLKIRAIFRWIVENIW